MCLMLDQFLWGHSSRVCDISCFEKMFFLKTVEAKVIIITRYVQPNETMTINTLGAQWKSASLETEGLRIRASLASLHCVHENINPSLVLV